MNHGASRLNSQGGPIASTSTMGITFEFEDGDAWRVYAACMRL
jgi:hypothetical protein